MDYHLSEFEKLTSLLRPMRTENEVVNNILDFHAKSEQINVTNVHFELFRVLEEDKSATDLRSIKDNLERIKVFKGIWLDKLRNILEKELLGTRGWIDLLTKNEAVADLLQKRGNEYFIKRNFDMALRAYTLAAMYAPKDSKSLALSYSNRSACFAETKTWNKCLEDIKSFERIWKKIEEGPTPTGEKVAKRKEKCLKEIGGDAEDISLLKKFGKTFFKLKKPRVDFPSLEDFLGVKADPKRGRGIYNVSDKAIEPGTLLIMDVAYSHVLFDAFGFQTESCNACHRILDGYGIPCGGCVFNLYCSEACATSDYHDIHAKYECKMASYLFEVLPRTFSGPGPGPNVHLALSFLLKRGPQALLDHYRLVFSKKGDKKDDESGKSFSSYLPIYNLICHDEILPEEQILEYSKYAVIITEILDYCTDYFTCLNLDELEANLLKEGFARRLLLHQMSNRVNANTIGYLDLPKGRPPTPEELLLDETGDPGYGIFPAVSLINHSCAPNASWFCLSGGVMAVMALEYIVPGQEILATYRSRYVAEEREERRKYLERFYNFKCECTACTGNWPVSRGLKSSRQKHEYICSECRIKFEAFHKIRLDYTPSAKAFVCPRKCGWKIGEVEMENNYFYFLELCNAAVKAVDGNKILKGFMNAKKCVRYFDANCSKPSKEIAVSVTAMEQPIVIVARRMFE